MDSKLKLITSTDLKVFCVGSRYSDATSKIDILLGYSAEDILQEKRKEGQFIDATILAFAHIKTILDAIDITKKQEDVSKQQFILNTKLIASEYVKDSKDKRMLERILDKVC